MVLGLEVALGYFSRGGLFLGYLSVAYVQSYVTLDRCANIYKGLIVNRSLSHSKLYTIADVREAAGQAV